MQRSQQNLKKKTENFFDMRTPDCPRQFLQLWLAGPHGGIQEDSGEKSYVVAQSGGLLERTQIVSFIQSLYVDTRVKTLKAHWDPSLKINFSDIPPEAIPSSSPLEDNKGPPLMDSKKETKVR